MERPCDYCEQPDTSLLRVVLIGEIIRADDDTLYTLAEVCEALELMQMSDVDDSSVPLEVGKRVIRHLQRVK